MALMAGGVAGKERGSGKPFRIPKLDAFAMP